MARIELIMPKMGESVSEATVISWMKEVGEIIEVDETIIEVATDKVDSEVPSTHNGKLIEKLFNVDETIQVGEVFAILENEEEEEEKIENSVNPNNEVDNSKDDAINIEELNTNLTTNPALEKINTDGKRFYSPLVKSIAKKEGISIEELSNINGTGKDNRVTKADIILYLNSKEENSKKTISKEDKVENNTYSEIQNTENIKTTYPTKSTEDTEVVEMDRMRKLISSHMTMSKKTSAHITSFVEADMTNIVNWRNQVKSGFKKREGQNITFTPIIIEAMAKAVKDFPMINVSVEDTNIRIHKNVNIGMATALPDGNLIVPVINQCQNKNLIGITKDVNDLANRARNENLKPDDIQGGTITMTNVGTFGNLMGTPIINQPQVAIMACGIIKKKPVVLETEFGDVIAIRHMMYLSLSYDHRVVDGALGGQFVKRVAEYLEKFDTNTTV